jgi:hypothetical protein
MGERVPLDGMDQSARLFARGNQVVPAAGGKMSALTIDGGQIARDWIQPAKVVQEPAVDFISAKRRLHGSDIERRRCGIKCRLRLGGSRHTISSRHAQQV